MINLVDGKPGGGKTFFAMRVLGEAVSAGRPVATNCNLIDGWSEQLAAANPLRRWRPGAIRTRAAELERLVHLSEDLGELFAVRTKGTDENRAEMILDEAHNWMNSRRWSDGDRADTVRWMSQHRKLGWRVWIITQYIDLIDKQVRLLVEHRIRVRNLRRERWHGIPMFPVDRFVAIWELDQSKSAHLVRREWFGLDKRVRGIYDTFQLSHGLEDEAAGIWLPRPLADIEAAPQGAA